MTTAFNQGRVPPIEMRHRLRIAREFAGYSQAELADAIGVSSNTIGNAEGGRVQVRKIVLNAWAMACGVPVDWIRTGEEPSGGDGPTSGLGIISTDVRVVSSKDASVTPLSHRSKTVPPASVSPSERCA